MTEFYEAPKVTVVSRPEFIHPPHLEVEFVDPQRQCIGAPGRSDGESLIEYSGRICYMSQSNPANRTNAEYITNILKQGHGSVLEHAVYGLLIEGVSRSLSHEFVRHRAGFAYSQLSQRYVDESDTAFVIPPAYLDMQNDVDFAPTLAEWKLEMRLLRSLYAQQVETLMKWFAHVEDRTHRRKMAREAARSVLPNCTETKFVATANIRAWRTMLELRCGEGADREIRRLAICILQELRRQSPACFADFEVYTTNDGDQAASVGYHKV